MATLEQIVEAHDALMEVRMCQLACDRAAAALNAATQHWEIVTASMPLDQIRKVKAYVDKALAPLPDKKAES